MNKSKSPYLRTIDKGKDTVISEDGEVLDVQNKVDYIVVDGDEQFFYTYASIVGRYKELSGAHIKVLSWLLINQTSYNNNMVTITKHIKKLIADQMGLSESAVNNCIKPLITKDILIRQGSQRSATYIVNPKYYWKGTRDGRKQGLKFTLTLQNRQSLEPNNNFENE